MEALFVFASLITLGLTWLYLQLVVQAIRYWRYLQLPTTDHVVVLFVIGAIVVAAWAALLAWGYSL